MSCSGTRGSTWRSAYRWRRAIPLPSAVWRLAGGTAARTVYRGPWEADIWPAYAVLLSWIVRHGYEPCGPAREFYVVDERDTDDPGRYVTQLTWTVREHASP